MEGSAPKRRPAGDRRGPERKRAKSSTRTSAARAHSITPRRRPELELHIDEVRRAFLEQRNQRRGVRLRREESVLRDAARHRARRIFEDPSLSWSQRFGILPFPHRLLLVLSIWVLALSIAASAHLLHTRMLAAKRTVYIAGGGSAGG